jgi:hypothetical protein
MTQAAMDSTMVAVMLKPCPWCGGEASADGHIRYSKPLADTWWEGGAPITEAFYVNCVKCGAVSRSGLVSGYQTKAEAIERWNTRHRIQSETGAALTSDGREAIRTVLYKGLEWFGTLPEPEGDVPSRYHRWDDLGEIADRILAALAQPVEAGEDVAQRLQDHMEQHHGVCLSASDWDAAVAAALGPRP